MNRSGILLVDKPDGMSSAAVVNQIKKKFDIDKIGHGGTLDPFATGLLVLLLGEGTKIARFLLDGDKTYEALARLGQETDTGDLLGKVVAESPAPHLSVDQWQELALQFTGKIQQVPPQFSAIKHQGKALYEYARKGESIQLEPREVEIHALEIMGASPTELRFRVRCGGGTYIRSLARDLAIAAGTHGHLLTLRRLASSKFSLEQAPTLQTLLDTPAEKLPLVPLQEALRHLPQLLCSPMEVELIRHGNLRVFQTLEQRFQAQGYFLLLAENSRGEARPLAIAAAHPQLQERYSLERVFDPALLES